MLALRRKNRIRAIAATINCILVATKIINKIRKKRIWMREYQHRYDNVPLVRGIQDSPDDYHIYLKMDNASFEILLKKITKKISKSDTVMRKSISAEQRLVITLRFLAAGRSFSELKNSSGVSSSSLSKLIPETCKAIYDVLKTEYLKFPSGKQEWLEIARLFQNRWQFINCGGVLSGVHVHIASPPYSGKTYSNHMNFCSMILLALVNADYEFVFAEAGKSGKLSDGRMIESTNFWQLLTQDQLNLPENFETTNNLNFVFAGGESFPLNEHILTPYRPAEEQDAPLTEDEQIFNYRLSRVQNVAENTFGVIYSRFQILHKPITMKTESINYILMAICVLHNFLRRHSSEYIGETTVDREDGTHRICIEGDWRKYSTKIHNLQSTRSKNETTAALENRNGYKGFFVS